VIARKSHRQANPADCPILVVNAVEIEIEQNASGKRRGSHRLQADKISFTGVR
jgi:hypothetical protein